MLDRFGPDGRLDDRHLARGERCGPNDSVAEGRPRRRRRRRPGAGAADSPTATIEHSLGERSPRSAPPGSGSARRRVIRPRLDRQRRRGPSWARSRASPVDSGYGRRGLRRIRAAGGRRAAGEHRKSGVKVRGGIRRAPARLGARRRPARDRGLAADRRPDRRDQQALEQLLRRDAAEAGRRPAGQKGDDRARANKARELRPRASAAARGCRTAPVCPQEGRLAAAGRATPGRTWRATASWRSRFATRSPIAGHERHPLGPHARDRRRGPLPAKTGTIDSVSALSGYCKADRDLIAFSILMNAVNVDAARRAQDVMAARSRATGARPRPASSDPPRPGSRSPAPGPSRASSPGLSPATT